jgi:hypothetical protein
LAFGHPSGVLGLLKLGRQRFTLLPQRSRASRRFNEFGDQVTHEPSQVTCVSRLRGRRTILVDARR